MRAITIRQPYGWAIFNGKPLENRTRNIAGNYRGPVAIHAALTWAPEGATDPNIVGAVCRANYVDAPIVEANGYVEPDQDEFLIRGAIIGVVDLVDVHEAWTCETEVDLNGEGACAYNYCSEWAMQGHWHLVTENPRVLAKPIPYTGHLGLWTLPDAVLAYLAQQRGDVE